MQNDINDYSKRTATRVASILKSNGLVLMPENLGDGNIFYIADSSLSTRLIIKRSGFILCRSNDGDKGVTFKSHN